MARKQPQPEFYETDDGTFVALTGESPKDFKGHLFVAVTGADPGSVAETCVSRDNLDTMTQIEDYEVPDDWADAFRSKGFEIEKFDPEPQPVPAVPQPVPAVPAAVPATSKSAQLTLDLSLGKGYQALLAAWVSLALTIFSGYSIWSFLLKPIIEAL